MAKIAKHRRRLANGKTVEVSAYSRRSKVKGAHRGKSSTHSAPKNTEAKRLAIRRARKAVDEAAWDMSKIKTKISDMAKTVNEFRSDLKK